MRSLAFFKAYFYDFYELWIGREAQIDIHGFSTGQNKIEVSKTVERKQFVPHQEHFINL